MEFNKSSNNNSFVSFENAQVSGSLIKPYPLVGEMSVNNSTRSVKQELVLHDSLNLNDIFKYAEDNEEYTTLTEQEPLSDTSTLEELLRGIDESVEEDELTQEELKDQDFSPRQVTVSSNFMKQIQENIKEKKQEISEIESENNTLSLRVEELKEEIGLSIVSIKVESFMNKIFKNKAKTKTPEDKELLAYNEMKEAKKQIAANKEKITFSKELIHQLEGQRSNFAHQIRNEKFQSVSIEGIDEKSSIQSFNKIKAPAREFRDIEKTFVGKMEFLRGLIQATNPKNQAAMLEDLDNVILSSKAFLERLGVGTRQQKILKALDPKELAVLFGHFCSYAEKNFISQASMKGFNLKAALKYLQNPELKLPDRVNRPTNEQGVLSLLQSLLIEPYQKAARYMLTFKELQKGLDQCEKEDPSLTPFANAVEEVRQPLELLTAVFNICCP